MSDKLKKRSLWWIWWGLLALLILYVLSSGPMFSVAVDPATGVVADWWEIAYRPIFWLGVRVGPIDRAFTWYINWFILRDLRR